MKLGSCIAAAAILAVADQAVGGTEVPARSSGFDEAWALMTLVENPDAGGLQKLALVGRAQVDSVWLDPDDGETFEDTNWRRFRFGLKATLFGEGTAHVEADFNLNEAVENWYTKLTDAYLAWAPTRDLSIKVLKQSAGFTLDGATSSKALLTLERNALTQNLWFTKEYFNGILAAGDAAEIWRYKAGLFSSDGDPEIGWDDASWFGLASLGVQAGDADLRLDYVYQDQDEQANTRDFEHALSVVGRWRTGRIGIWGDLAGGRGFETLGQEDVWGLVIMPFYDFSTSVQAVCRYTYLSGDEAGSVRLNRYDDEVTDERGDEYQEVYVGLNVFFYGHKCKWQSGLAWTELSNLADAGGTYEGMTLATGLRVSW